MPFILLAFNFDQSYFNKDATVDGSTQKVALEGISTLIGKLYQASSILLGTFDFFTNKTYLPLSLDQVT